jgi:NAD(P)-dependent dehydrogenase (short-subunit alcohol dehydrogenase family)
VTGLDGRLDGRVALVTGATRGLGHAIALGLAEAGATVVVSSRKADACEAAAEAVTKATGVAAMPLALHVGQWDTIEPAVDRVYADLGRLDVLVNNAGIAPLSPTLESVSQGLFDKTIEVNLKGPFRLMAVAGARMAAAGGGSIVNISSIGAVRPSPAEAMYAASKNGLNALTMAFAQEYAPHVRVNCVMPGAFATDMADGWDEEFVGKVVDRLPAGRLGRPEEMVGLVVHLAGDGAAYTTGAVIPVDGGRTAVY